MILHIEHADVTEKSLNVLHALYALGVRSLGFTHNVSSCAADGCLEARDGVGLTAFGVRLVREMNALGMVVDLAHVSPAAFFHALEASSRPVLFSHGNARALCDHPRNLTDRQLKDLFRAGGYIGINFFPRFLAPEGAPCDVGTVVSHIDRCHQLGGAGMVGFGSDFDGITQKPAGLDNPEDFPKLIEELRARGYKEQDVRNIAGQSFLDYFGRIGTGR